MAEIVTDKLILNLDKVTEVGMQLDVERPVSVFYTDQSTERSKTEKLDEMVVGPIRTHLELMRINFEEFRLAGTVSTRVRHDCDRCLEPFERDYSESFELLAVPTGSPRIRHSPKEAVVDLREEDLGLLTYSNRIVDLKEVLREQIELLFPIQYLCQDDCPGLCTACGEKLPNSGACSCRHREHNGDGSGNRPFRFLS